VSNAPIITDLVQIRMLGEKKRPENEKFRRHLKSRDHSDRILRRIAEGIEEQIDCTVCANCCRVATVKVSERDIERLAHALRIKPAKFLAEYTIESEEEGTILRRSRETGCVFLDGNDCTVYEARPETCQRFPNVVRGNGSIASRMWQFIDRACYCPIVYNALEAFKVETGFKR
jgi:Fe-S-cluster containining protein